LTRKVYLADIWPTNAEIRQAISQAVQPEMFTAKYANVFSGNETWNAIQGGESELYNWDLGSTYIQEPPFFATLTTDPPRLENIGGQSGARVLALLGDSITTDHISPAGSIPADSPAGKYLIERGVTPRDFNSYGSRRGNDRIMTRGTLANIRLKNLMVPGMEGGYTIYYSAGLDVKMTIYEAAMKYRQDGIPLIILAGKEYGTGSSRDWAAKGTNLLGVKAVIAESFERIHRSNLVGMGVLPLQFKPGQNIVTLGLTGEETYFIEGLGDDMGIQAEVEVRAIRPDGNEVRFQVIARLDTPVDVEYYRNGGILHTVLRSLLLEGSPTE
jgi:aconitate hydratase